MGCTGAWRLRSGRLQLARIPTANGRIHPGAAANWRNGPHRPGFQRLAVDVEHADVLREDVRFALPSDIPASESGNPRVALMLPAAAASREGIRVDSPADRCPIQNAEMLLPFRAGWHPRQARRVPIFANAQPPGIPQRELLACFSAGAGSFLTVPRHPESRSPLTSGRGNEPRMNVSPRG